MKAVILAAGKGKRMRPFTLETPKPLLRVGGKTFLERIINTLPNNVNEIIIVVGYKGKQIKKFFGNQCGGRKIYYVVQKELNGTGRALLLARKYFSAKGGSASGGKKKERFLILNGDELITKKEVKDCLSCKFSWITRQMDNPESFGVVTVSEDGKIISVTEKPEQATSNLVVGGLRVVDTDIFRYRPARDERGEYCLVSMMNEFARDHRVMAIAGVDDIDKLSPQNPEHLNKMNKNEGV